MEISSRMKRILQFVAVLHTCGATQVASLFDSALDFHQQGNTLSAASFYEQFLSEINSDSSEEVRIRHPQHAVALHNLAVIAVDSGDRERALALVDASIDVDPNDANSFHTRAVLQRGNGNHEDAAQSFHGAVRLAPEVVNARLGLANLLHYDIADPLQFESASFEHFQQLIAEAVTHYNRALESSDQRRRAQEIGSEGGDGGGGSMLGRGEEVAVRNHLSIALQKLGRFADARTALERAVELDPSHLQSLGNLAVVLKELGDLKGAAAVGRQAASHMASSSSSAQAQAQVRFNLGLTLQAMGEIEAAAQEWRLSLDADPGLWQAKESLGHVAGHRGKLQEAKQWYEEALETLLLLGGGGENGAGTRVETEGSAVETAEGSAAGGGSSRSGGGGSGDGEGGGGGRDGVVIEADALRLQIATACVPQIYDSPSHISHVRMEYAAGLRRLLALPPLPEDSPCNGEEGPPVAAPYHEQYGQKQQQQPHPQKQHPQKQLYIPSPLTSTGSGAMGYYLIYTGHNDVGNRRLLASVYWKASPILHFVAPFLLNRAPPPPPPLLPPIKPSAAERTKQPEELGMAERDEKELSTRRPHRPVRVGFMSAFFFHHSVGLLMRGVITGLAAKTMPSPPTPSEGGGGGENEATTEHRHMFHVVLLYSFDPLLGGGNSSSGGDGDDAVFSELKSAVHATVELPAGDVAACQRLVAAQSLDLLVFAEVGMDRLNYFLAFSRLAHRSALFWGHATTSGITPVDDDDDDDKHHHHLAFMSEQAGGSDDQGSEGEVESGRVMMRGGIDYFVSSELFESSMGGGQQRYSERLYLMRGLTTKFKRPPSPLPPRSPPPPPPSTSQQPTNNDDDDDDDDDDMNDMDSAALKLAKDLGLPPLEPFLTRKHEMKHDQHHHLNGQGSPDLNLPLAHHLYLVPQTLYKLHPDFDVLLKGVLEADPLGIVAMPQANEDGWTEKASRRIAVALDSDNKNNGDNGDDNSDNKINTSQHNKTSNNDNPLLRARVFTVRRLAFWEFSLLARMAHVVLDPFPVGGGRSSFEVLAVGTPIVMLYPRTSILQLTHGMYRAMGLVRAETRRGRSKGGELDDDDEYGGDDDDDGDGDNGRGCEGSGSRRERHRQDDDDDGCCGEAGCVAQVLVAHSSEGFVASAVAVGTNPLLRRTLHAAIEEKSHRLYGQDSVVEEWAEFIAFACTAPRPNPTVPWWQAEMQADQKQQQEDLASSSHHQGQESGGGRSRDNRRRSSSSIRKSSCFQAGAALSARCLFGDGVSTTTTMTSTSSEGWPSDEALAVAVERAVNAEAAHIKLGALSKSKAPVRRGTHEGYDTNLNTEHVSDDDKEEMCQDKEDRDVEERTQEDAAIAAQRLEVITFEVPRHAYELAEEIDDNDDDDDQRRASRKRRKRIDGVREIVVNGNRTKPLLLSSSPPLEWHWAKRPGIGWEYEPGRLSSSSEHHHDDDDGDDTGPLLLWPNERAFGLAYAVKVSHEPDAAKVAAGKEPASRSFLVEVWSPSTNSSSSSSSSSNGSGGSSSNISTSLSPALSLENLHYQLESAAEEVAAKLSAFIDAEPVKARWISCLLRRGAMLGAPPLITSPPLSVTPNLEKKKKGAKAGPSKRRQRGEVIWTFQMQLVDAETKEPLAVVASKGRPFSWGADTVHTRSGSGGGDDGSGLDSGGSGDEEGSGGGIPVRFGDDLAQLASWIGHRFDLGEGAVGWLRQRLEYLTPEHASDPLWIEARASACAQQPLLSSAAATPISAATHLRSPLSPPGVPTTPVIASKNSRSTISVVGSKSDSAERRFSSSPESEHQSCRITVGITSCKRFDLFRQTAASLLHALGPRHFKPLADLNNNSSSSVPLLSPLVCRVLVVDDGSSDDDVLAMRHEFPWFEYVLKPSHRKGHADSLNLLLDLVRGSSSGGVNDNWGDYFLYLEDDWLLLDKPHSSSNLANGDGGLGLTSLMDAVEILDASRVTRRRVLHHPLHSLTSSSSSSLTADEAVDEVLLNDQSSRACAYAVTEACLHQEPSLGTAGWPRSLKQQQQQQQQQPRSGRAAKAPHNNNNGSVEYRLHEFGYMGQPGGAFGYWPGFSLNPGLWDLAALDAKVKVACAAASTENVMAGSLCCRPVSDVTEEGGSASPGNAAPSKLMFHTGDRRFEQSMSLMLAAAGARVAYLPRMTFRHLGLDESAYELNGMERPWDRSTPLVPPGQ